ncbi:MAG: ADP-ribosylglycohydrolase family protein [Bacteroidales bacterium]|nr:ADP-ribosylglycohydrolase family protein [Bacteroidales bacterium]
MTDAQTPHADAIIGCLLGQAVGDMMGLPMENLSPRRIARLFPCLDRPRLLLGYGMGSDDTEHACMTAQALLRSGGDVRRFRRSLGWQLRWWSLALPAGIGRATLRACLRLWLGWSPQRSGVRSAGNGPAMRAAILFVTANLPHGNASSPLEGDPSAIGDCSAWLAAATAITHTHPQVFAGVRLIAGAAQCAAQTREQPFDANTVLERLAHIPQISGHIADSMMSMTNAYHAGLTVEEFVMQMGWNRGVSGYVAHTVPVALYAFLRHPDDYQAAITAIIRCGGDTDTVAAITGALVGIRVGKAGIPAAWRARWVDWPRSLAHMESLGHQLAARSWQHTPQRGVPFAGWAIPFRNLLFLVIVLGHVLRRGLPPY